MLTRERQIELMELALGINTRMFDFMIACIKKKIDQVKALKDTATEEYWEETLRRNSEEDFVESPYGPAGNPLDELSLEERDFITKYMPNF